MLKISTIGQLWCALNPYKSLLRVELKNAPEGGRAMRGRWVVRVAAGIVSAATIATSGCYIFSPSQADVNKAATSVHFNLSQCEQTAPNLYKCPSVDKSICGAFYAGQQVDCLYLDKDGNAVVMKQ
jgi:hypothetical protein